MIPIIGFMIGMYIIVRMCDYVAGFFYAPDEFPPFLRTFLFAISAATIFITIVGIISLFQSSVEAEKSLGEVESLLGKLKNLSP